MGRAVVVTLVAVVARALGMIMRLVVVRRVVVVLRAFIGMRPAGVIMIFFPVAVVHGARVAVVEVRMAVGRLFRLELRFRGLRFFQRRHGLLLGDGLAVLLEHVGRAAGEHGCYVLCGDGALWMVAVGAVSPASDGLHAAMRARCHVRIEVR